MLYKIEREKIARKQSKSFWREKLKRQKPRNKIEKGEGLRKDICTCMQRSGTFFSRPRVLAEAKALVHIPNSTFYIQTQTQPVHRSKTRVKRGWPPTPGGAHPCTAINARHRPIDRFPYAWMITDTWRSSPSSGWETPLSQAVLQNPSPSPFTLSKTFPFVLYIKPKKREKKNITHFLSIYLSLSLSLSFFLSLSHRSDLENKFTNEEYVLLI